MVIQMKAITDNAYHVIVEILNTFLWDGDLLGEENLPESGPAVFVANHLGPLGPIGAICSLPLRLYPWIMADMLDREKAAAYLSWDFIERVFKIKPPLGLTLAKLLSKITVPMLTSFGTIPAFQSIDDIQGALKISVELLRERKCILICPEDVSLPQDPVTKMSPFKKGFTRLGELFYAESRRYLQFYPVTIHESHKAILGRPITFNPKFSLPQERLRLKNLLEATIRNRYIEVSIEGMAGVTQAH
jgi:Acyltransferase